MKYRTLDKQAKKVSALWFRLCMEWAFAYEILRRHKAVTPEKALDLGRHPDTADIKCTGKWSFIFKVLENIVTKPLATKFGFRYKEDNLNPKTLFRVLSTAHLSGIKSRGRKQPRRLNTDVIDLYYAHRMWPKCSSWRYTMQWRTWSNKVKFVI